MANTGVKLVEFIPGIDFELEDGEAIELITWDNAAGNFIVNDDAIENLLEITGNIGFAVFCGEVNSGKSTLANHVMGIDQSRGFQKSDTIGISYWTIPIYKPQSELNIYLLDVSGFGSDRGRNVDDKIWAMIFLQSSLVIYNTKKEINEHTFSNLNHFRNISKYLAADCEDESHDYALSYYAPRLLWALRDVNPEDLVLAGGSICDSDNYFGNSLREVPNANSARVSDNVIQNNIKLRNMILNTYKDKECIDFPFPFTGNDQRDTVHRFNTQVFKLRERVLSRMNPKQFDGINFTSRMMVSFITCIVENLNDNNKLFINDILCTVEDQECISSYNDAYQKYMDNLKSNFMDQSDPYGPTELARIIKDIRQQSLDAYSDAAIVKDIAEEAYNEYLEKLKDFLNKKEQNCIQLNQELAKDVNKEFIEDATKNLIIGVNNMQINEKNVMMNELRKIYDLYTTKSIKPDNTTHFVESFQEQNKNLLLSFCQSVHKDANNHSGLQNITTMSQVDHENAERQKEIEDKEQEIDDIDMKIQNKDLKEQEFLEQNQEIDSEIKDLQSKIDQQKEQNKLLEDQIKTMDTEMEKKENDKKILMKKKGGLCSKDGVCVIF